MVKLSPRAEAIAFRIWQHCEPIGWDCTTGEAARALGLVPQQVGNIAKLKGWQSRFRVDPGRAQWFAVMNGAYVDPRAPGPPDRESALAQYRRAALMDIED